MSGGRLPNLLVAGVPKAGTGSLFAYLTQHPEVCGGDRKEVGFLNFYDPRRHTAPPPPVEQYAAHFVGCGEERYVVDASPSYSYGGQPVIDAAQRLLDRPRVVLSLRDPVDRLWSAYTFQRSLGNITSLHSFEEYLAACERRPRDGHDLVTGDHLHGLYIGYYADYVGQWLDAFGPDLRIVFVDDLVRDRLGVVHDLFRWLDLDPDAVPVLDLGARNTTKHPRSTGLAKAVFSLKRAADRWGAVPGRLRRPVRRAYERLNSRPPSEQLSPEARRHVEELYRASNEELARTLTAGGYRDLPPWLCTAPASR